MANITSVPAQERAKKWPKVGEWGSSVLRQGTAVILFAVPFHALFTAWLASNFGHFDALRIWKEILLFVFCLIGVNLLIVRKSLFRELWITPIFRLMCAYLALSALAFFGGLLSHTVSSSAAIYGLMANTRMFVFFVVVFVGVRSSTGARTAWSRWRYWVLVPAALVIGFGLLQLVLPADSLRHVGYGPTTLPAYQTVDNKPALVRLQSTLRGPNPLGAYLVAVLPLLIAFGLWRGSRTIGERLAWLHNRRLLLYALFSLAGGIVLFRTYSRSAWLGMMAALGALAWLWFGRYPRARTYLILCAVGLVVLAAGSFVALRHNDTFQNLAFHTNERSTSPQSSNQKRASALQAGARDVAQHPFGGGIGTAGPASFRNTKQPAKIAENYFLQVGQEAGWAGMILFVWITIVCMQGLYARRTEPLAVGLFAALVGLTVVNLISHAWSDDTLAYTFWGLAAIALALPPKSRKIVNKI